MKQLLWFAVLCITCNFKLNSQTVSKEDTRLQKLVESKIKTSVTDSLAFTKKKELLEGAFGLVEEMSNDSLRLKMLSNISYYIPPEEATFFKKVNTETRQLAIKIKDSMALANAYWDLGFFYTKNAVKDSAYYSYSEAQNIFEEQGNQFLSARMLYNMAKQQQEIRDYIGSEVNAIAAIERLKPLLKYRELYNAYNTLAINSQELREYDQALRYYDQALNYLFKLENPEDLLIKENMNNRGMVYNSLKEYHLALENFEKNLSNMDSLESDRQLYAKTLRNISVSKIRLEDTLGVSKLIKKAIQLNQGTGDRRELAYSFFTKAEYLLVKGDSIEAIKYAYTTLNLAKEVFNNDLELETYAFLANIDNKNASKYAQKYFTLSDSLQQEERQARNKFARIRFETDEFIAQNEQLEEETAILAKQKQIWSGVALGFFLLGISVYTIINQRAKNQKLIFAQQQQANNQEIFNLMLTQKQKVDEVKRMEQKRISEELHDGVLGKMLGARMVLTGLNKKTGQEAIEARMEAIKALKNVEEEVRSISHELSHSAYQKINNFINSVEDLLGSAKENSKIITTFNYDEDEDYDALKGEIKINLYRMIQECLQNAIKHSHGKNFFLDFQRFDNTLRVAMGDDGKGFDMEKERKGIGMRNISSRVEKLNGTWQMESEPQGGTTITLEIPLHFMDSNTNTALERV